MKDLNNSNVKQVNMDIAELEVLRDRLVSLVDCYSQVLDKHKKDLFSIEGLINMLKKSPVSVKMKKECKHCKKEFESKQSNHVFCNQGCSYEFSKWNKPNRKRWIRSKEQIYADNISGISDKEVKERQQKFFKDNFAAKK